MAFFDISARIQVLLIAASLVSAGCYASGDRYTGDARDDARRDAVELDAPHEDIPDVAVEEGQVMCSELDSEDIESEILDHTNEWAVIGLTYNLGREYEPGESSLRVDVPYYEGTVEEITSVGAEASFKYILRYPATYRVEALIEVAWRLECVRPEGLTTEEIYDVVCLVYWPDESGDTLFEISHDSWDCDPAVCICHAPVMPFSMNIDAYHENPFAVFIHASALEAPGTLELVPEVKEAKGPVSYEWRATAGKLERLPDGRALWRLPPGCTCAIAQLTVSTEYGFCVQTYRHNC